MIIIVIIIISYLKFFCCTLSETENKLKFKHKEQPWKRNTHYMIINLGLTYTRVCTVNYIALLRWLEKKVQRNDGNPLLGDGESKNNWLKY